MSRREAVPFLPFDMPTEAHDMRRANRNRILRSIITRGPATRAELARRTGMSRPTVSVIATELLAAGVLAEGGRVSSGGAPGTLLEMALESGVTVVADIRKLDEVTLATVTVTGDLGSSAVIAVRTEADLLRGIEEFAGGIPRHTLIGVAIAVDGFVDLRGDWVRNTSHTINVGILDQLRRSVRMPVFPVNATDAATIADLRNSPEGLTAQATLLGEGMGLGVLVQGRLFNGQRRAAGDISHVVPGPPGPACVVCGRTCLSALMAHLVAADSTETRAALAAGIAAVMAPIVAAVELEEIVLSLFPPLAAAQICELATDGLRSRLPADLVPAVRLSAQGPDAVLKGAATMMLFNRLN